MGEIWKDISGYEGLYQVSNLGRVKSLNYNHTRKDKVLKPGINKSGYLHVRLSNNNQIKQYLVHRIICESFLSNTENKEQVNHKNGIKSDNRLENLEWCTRSENQKHAYSIGLQSMTGAKNPMFGKFGADSHSSKPVLQYSEDGEFIREYAGAREAMRITGINNVGIMNCCKERVKTAGRYVWKYKNI